MVVGGLPVPRNDHTEYESQAVTGACAHRSKQSEADDRDKRYQRSHASDPSFLSDPTRLEMHRISSAALSPNSPHDALSTPRLAP